MMKPYLYAFRSVNELNTGSDSEKLAPCAVTVPEVEYVDRLGTCSVSPPAVFSTVDTSSIGPTRRAFMMTWS